MKFLRILIGEYLEQLCQEDNINLEDLFNHLDWMCSETLINEWTHTKSEEE